MSKTNAVAVNEQMKAVVTFDSSAFDEFSGAGAEDVTVHDRKIPLLKILEPLSDNLKKNNEKFIAGASAGEIVDTSVNEVVGTEIEFVPVKFEKSFIEWQDKKPLNRHKNRDILSKCEFRDKEGQKKGYFLPNGNEVAETAIFYGINVTAGGIWSAISMAGGRLPAGGTFLEQLMRLKMPNGKQAPFFFKVWDLKAVDATSKSGHSFYTWKAVPGLNLQEREDGKVWYDEAVSFYNILKEGKASADLESTVDNGTDDQSIPF